jgi:hypothetical protein
MPAKSEKKSKRLQKGKKLEAKKPLKVPYLKVELTGTTVEGYQP